MGGPQGWREPHIHVQRGPGQRVLNAGEQWRDLRVGGSPTSTLKGVLGKGSPMLRGNGGTRDGGSPVPVLRGVPRTSTTPRCHPAEGSLCLAPRYLTCASATARCSSKRPRPRLRPPLRQPPWPATSRVPARWEASRPPWVSEPPGLRPGGHTGPPWPWGSPHPRPSHPVQGCRRRRGSAWTTCGGCVSCG